MLNVRFGLLRLKSSQNTMRGDLAGRSLKNGHFANWELRFLK
jgi:hypothetical protein